MSEVTGLPNASQTCPVIVSWSPRTDRSKTMTTTTTNHPFPQFL